MMPDRDTIVTQSQQNQGQKWQIGDRELGSKFQVPSFEFRVSSFELQVSGCQWRVASGEWLVGAMTPVDCFIRFVRLFFWRKMGEVKRHCVSSRPCVLAHRALRAVKLLA